MQSDRDFLKARLAESVEELRRSGWTVETGSQSKTSQEFAHARRRIPGGIDEAMVTVQFGDNEWLDLKTYALPRGVYEWIQCDESSFWGFIDDGVEGLELGYHFPRPTHCPCGKKVHRSLIRGEGFARKVAQEAGVDALQRPYRCPWNARAVHLSSKKRGTLGEPIPGAYVVLTEGWNT